MLTTLGPTFLTTGATLVAALSSRLMGVSSMVSLGAEFVLPDAGAAPLGKAAAKAIRIERLPHAADCWVKRDSEILFMLFSLTPILHSGTYGILPYVTPCLTLRGAIRSKHASPVVTLRPGRARRPSTWKMDQVCQPDRHGSTNERTLIASILPSRACFSHKLMYLTPCRYSLGAKGALQQTEFPPQEAHALLTLLNSLTLNFYARSKVSTGVSVHHLYELPIPKLSATHKKKLAASSAKLLKDPRDVKERAALEVFIAR